jgi:hypothetical protein
MKHMRLKTAVLAILALVVLLSLVGCIPLQKQETKEDAGEPAETSVEEDVADVEEDVEELENITEEVNETDELEVELEEETPEEPEGELGIPVKEAVEGDKVSFPNLTATDPDGDTLIYTFTEPLDEDGNWQTEVGDAGEYMTSITVSDGKSTVSQGVKIIIHPLNQAPVIALESKEFEINEGDTITLDVNVTDPDGDDVYLTYEGWMREQSKTTTYTDAGRHAVTIIASDGSQEAKVDVSIIVNNVNRAPELDLIKDALIKEGDKITIAPHAIDPDGDQITYTFSEPLDDNGVWTTGAEDVGTYRINVTASDGNMTDETGFFVVVESLNKAPLIELTAPEITVEEGDTVMITANITDPENDELTITYSGWMNANSYTTDYDDAGTHFVTISVSDGMNEVAEDVTIIVTDNNRPPQFDPGSFS